MTHPLTRLPYGAEYFTAGFVDALCDMVREPLQRVAIDQWTQEQLDAVGDWALRLHCYQEGYATVTVPNRPAFVESAR